MSQDEREIHVLRFLYPGASVRRINKLHKLAIEKRVKIIDAPKGSAGLDSLMLSIIRHEETQYESCLRSGLTKESARGLIGPIVKMRLKQVKADRG